jgi:hypothetical protein
VGALPIHHHLHAHTGADPDPATAIDHMKRARQVTVFMI